jgi:hypothetical protein
MTTIESFSGQRYVDITLPAYQYQSSFLMWHAPSALGGSNYSNTPVGSVSHVQEPGGWIYLQTYYGLWAIGKNFAICAWNARLPGGAEAKAFQAVGDPFVTK